MGEIITDAFLKQAIYTNLDLSFQNAWQAGESWADKVSMKVPSNTRSTRHAWLTNVGKFKEYLGEKQVERLSTRAYVLTNKKYELTIEIPEEDLEDDQLGMWGKTAEMMGRQAAKWPDDMLLNVIQNGKTLTCFDGQPFFNGSHPVNADKTGLGTYANLITATPLTPTNFGIVWQKMQQFKSDDGRPLPVVPFLTVVDPSNAVQIRQILNNTLVGVNTTGSPGGVAAVGNVMQGITDSLVIPELGNEAGVWYMLATLGGVKPFLRQIRKEPVTTPMTSATAGNVFWHDKLVWGAKARGNAGYTFPFLAVRVEPS